MKRTLARVISDAQNLIQMRAIGVYILVVQANLISWTWALATLHEYPILLGTAFARL